MNGVTARNTADPHLAHLVDSILNKKGERSPRKIAGVCNSLRSANQQFELECTQTVVRVFLSLADKFIEDKVLH